MFCVEVYLDGMVLLYMFCVDIDYLWVEVWMIYGKLGVKIWIYCGEILLEKKFVKGGN